MPEVKELFLDVKRAAESIEELQMLK